MIKQRWRIPLFILAGTGWGWMLTLPRLHEMAYNHQISSSQEWFTLLAIDLVLLAIDLGTLWYLLTPPRDPD